MAIRNILAATALVSSLAAPAMAQTQVFQNGPYGAIITQPGQPPQTASVFQNGNTTTYTMTPPPPPITQPGQTDQSWQQYRPGQNWQQFQPR